MLHSASMARVVVCLSIIDVPWLTEEKCAFFQQKTGHILEMVRDTAKVTIITNRKVAYAFSK